MRKTTRVKERGCNQMEGSHVGPFAGRRGGKVPEPSQAEISRAESDRAMRLAVSSGVPLPNSRTLIAEGAAVRVVDLKTERYDGPPRDVGPEGSSCEALSSDEEGVVVCYGQTSVALVSHVLGSHPRTERQFRERPPCRTPLVRSSLAGSARERKRPGLCASDVPGLVEHDMRKAVAGNQVALWVPKEGGGADAILGRTIPASGVVQNPARLDEHAGPWLRLHTLWSAGRIHISRCFFIRTLRDAP